MLQERKEIDGELDLETSRREIRIMGSKDTHQKIPFSLLQRLLLTFNVIFCAAKMEKEIFFFYHNYTYTVYIKLRVVLLMSLEG